MTPAFKQLLNRYAMPGFEHQIALSEVLDEADNWKLAPKAGTVTFGSGRTYPLQFLGSRSNATNTWLWSWANKGEGIPATALEAAKRARQVGKKRSIGELEVDTLDLDHFDFDAHTLALVATAVAGLPAYFRFPYEGGTLFAAFGADSIKLPPPDLKRIARVIQEVVGRFDLDARTAISAYAIERGAQVQADKTTLIAGWPDGRRLAVDFDAAGKPVRIVPSVGERSGQQASVP